MNDRYKLNKELAQMLKGGVIMDVTTPEQARIAQEAGACAVMALERIPADIRAAGGVSRMSDPKMIKGIQEAVSIPVMAKCRIGHFAEAQILEAIEIDYIDESEVLSPADDVYHIDKIQFKVPFVCGARDLGEALRRIAEGASMIRTKGEPGTGDVVQAVRHMRAMNAEIRRVQGLRDDELFEAAKQLQVPVDRRAALGRLGPRSTLLRVGTGPFHLTHQLLPCRSARRRQSAVLCAGVCGHPVAQVGTGEGADAVAALEGDASFAGHCRDQRGHLHHPILHQRRGRAAARRVPERPEGHPLPLVGGAHPQPVDAAVPAVAELQRIHAARRLYCAGGRKRKLVFYHPETSFLIRQMLFRQRRFCHRTPPGQKCQAAPGCS